MQIKKFQKRKEDFICENCGTTVSGDGFTNHCPECFVSKHVDIFPGDRKETCQGLMDVTEVRNRGADQQITHTCRVCKHISGDHVRKGDNFDNLVEIVKEINKKREIN